MSKVEITVEQPETKVVVYDDAKAFEKEAKRLARDGWQVSSTNELRQGAGIGRMVTLGLFSIARPPKSKVTVSYSRMVMVKKKVDASEAVRDRTQEIGSGEFVICPRCSGQVPVSSLFCPFCGLQRLNPPR